MIVAMGEWERQRCASVKRFSRIGISPGSTKVGDRDKVSMAWVVSASIVVI
jgi:hypothetical protein